MYKHVLTTLLFMTLSLIAQEGVSRVAAAASDEPIKSPQQIQEEIQQAQKDYERAKKMFVPWYTGPLITPSPTMIPPGIIMTQPYVFVNDNYASFNNHRHSVSGPSLVNMNPLVVFQTGVTKNMDMLLILQGDVNWLNHHSSGGFGDLVLSPGFNIYSQTVYVPQMKAFIQQSFPTGKYQNLNPHGHGLDAIGKGAFQTQVGMIFGKIIFWQYQHPMNIRLSLGYTISSAVSVENFNAYGGGYGTKGSVYPAGVFATDFGMEISLTEAWVFAMDIVYNSSGTTEFIGTPGTALDGTVASMNHQSSNNLSFAPAFEYNWTENLGIIAGVQFSVYGRNSSNFVSGIVSVCYVFQAN